MPTRTPEQVLKDEQIKMGKDQGRVFNALKNQVLCLEIKWKEFQTLYCNSDNVKILNRSASFFFSMNQQIMQDDIILSISKIASARGKTYKYLSLSRLPDFVKLEFKEPLQKMINEAFEKAKFVNRRRNRSIAHISLSHILNEKAHPIEDIHIQNITDVIEAFKKIIIYVYVEILHEAVFMDTIYPLDNAKALVRRLEKTL